MKRLFCLLLALLLAGCAPPRALPADGPDARPVLIVMYHAILNDPARAGKYVLSPDVLESDIVWLLKEGYSFVTLRELAAFAGGKGGLPDKPALLTFDDGHLGFMDYVLPLLEKYDCRAAVGVVGEYTQRYTDSPDPNPSYAYLSRADVTALALSNRVEFMNHSYAMHGQSGRMGSGRMAGESNKAYARAFSADMQKCQALILDCTGTAPISYAYPFGIVGDGSRELLLKMGVGITLTCRERVSLVVRGEMDSLLELGRFNRPSGPTSEEFFRDALSVGGERLPNGHTVCSRACRPL